MHKFNYILSMGFFISCQSFAQQTISPDIINNRQFYSNSQILSNNQIQQNSGNLNPQQLNLPPSSGTILKPQLVDNNSLPNVIPTAQNTPINQTNLPNNTNTLSANQNTQQLPASTFSIPNVRISTPSDYNRYTIEQQNELNEIAIAKKASQNPHFFGEPNSSSKASRHLLSGYIEFLLNKGVSPAKIELELSRKTPEQFKAWAARAQN